MESFNCAEPENNGSTEIHRSFQSPLLVQDHDEDVKTTSSQRTRLNSHHLLHRRMIFLHVALIILYTLTFWVIIHQSQACDIESKPPAGPTSHLSLPDRDGLVWEERKFPTSIVNNPFTGEPNPEMDAAWHRLLLNDNIKLSKDFVNQKGLTTIYTKDDRHAIVSLSVYHSLHCLKKVKRMLFKEYYHKGKSADSMLRENKHVDHCIEYIREALMCQPDLSLVTFRWINNTAQHENKSEFWPTNFDVDMHKCASWEMLDNWAGQRAFDLFEIEKLQRPES